MGKLNILVLGTLLCGLLLLTDRLFAVPPDTDFIIAQYTDEHGLPQNSVKGIGKDNFGFVWLITEKGVVRYDGGSQFKIMDDLSRELASDRMFTLHADTRSDELWAQTGAGEMICLKDGRAVLSERSFRDIFGELETTIPESLGFIYQLPSIYPDFSPFGIEVFDGNRFTVQNDSSVHNPNSRIPHPYTAPFLDHDRKSFFSLDGRLFYIDKLHTYQAFDNEGMVTTGKMGGDLLHVPAKTPFEFFWNTAAGQLFVYTDKKCYRIVGNNRGKLTSQLLFAGFDFAENRITSAYYDAERELLLLGSETKGLFVMQRRRFHVINAKEDAPRNPYYIQTLLDNKLLVTNSGLAFYPDGTPKSLPLLRPGKQDNQIVGPGGNLWVLRADSILVFSPDAKRLLRKKNNPTVGKVILRDSTGTYWLGGDQGKVLSYDAAKDTFSLRATLPYPVSFMAQAGNNDILIGTHKGLFRLCSSNDTYQEIPEFRNRFIRSIYRESDNRHWVCTYQHGFFLYERGEVTAFPLDERQYLATTHCMLADKRGYLWISTNKGLFQVRKQQLLDYAKDTRHIPYYVYYDNSHGFSTNEFNGGCQPCAVELPNGNFSFPSLDGLVWFDPLSLVSEFPSGKIILDEARLDGESLAIADTIHIPQQFSRLDLKIATPFYGNFRQVTIQYQLYSKRKLPKGWLPLSGNNTISINELVSGNHEVRVRIRQGAAYDDFRYVTFHLYVTPLFYDTWWFRLIAYSCIGLLIWMLIQIRTKLVLKQNRMLAQKVAERTADLNLQYQRQRLISASITHDIKAPLKYVVKALQGIEEMDQREGVPPGQIAQIYHSTKHIYSYADNLTKLAKVLLDDGNLKFTDVNIYQTVQKQVDVFSPLAKLHLTEIANDIPQDCMAHTHAEILAIIIHNLLDNAVKFTDKGTIRLTAQQHTDGTLTLFIIDTGTGLDDNELNTGLGLRLVGDISRLIHMEIVFRSVHGQGTNITLILPKNPEH